MCSHTISLSSNLFPNNMSLFILERLALVGTLVSLVLAVIWPHFEPFYNRFFGSLILSLFSSETASSSSPESDSMPWTDHQKDGQKPRLHLKLSGQAIKRATHEQNVSQKKQIEFHSNDKVSQSLATLN